jgi:cell division protease FtsH
MSPQLGPMSYGKKEEQIFLGREIATHKDYSDETAKRIDAEIAAIISSGYEKTKTILSENLATLHRLADELIKREVLNAEDLDAIISGRVLPEQEKTEGSETIH